jgi:hypothetical protein
MFEIIHMTFQYLDLLWSSGIWSLVLRCTPTSVNMYLLLTCSRMWSTTRTLKQQVSLKSTCSSSWEHCNMGISGATWNQIFTFSHPDKYLFSLLTGHILWNNANNLTTNNIMASMAVYMVNENNILRLRGVPDQGVVATW